MNLRLMDKYISICREFNKPITFEGMKLFRKIFS